MILSDTSIAAGLANGRFIEGGDQAFVGPCSYQFRAGKIFTGGEPVNIVDWTVPPANAVFVIKPGAMVWIRMRERVSLPNNVCATWWQTNTLSKKGIMLINMSVVDPGYQGQLACLFVNFGKVSVPINPGTTVAKLLFHVIDHDVAHPFTGRTPDPLYDDDLYAVALAGPSSFLNVSQLSTELIVQKEKILTDIADEAPKRVRRAFVWAFLGLVLLVAALSFVPWLQTQISPNLKDFVGKVVDEHLIERLSVATPDPPDKRGAGNPAPPVDQTQAILKRLEGIEQRLSGSSGPTPPAGGAPSGDKK